MNALKSSKPSKRQRLIGVRSSADGSQLRTDTYNGVSYIVVPIISAVGNQVWWPANAATPELILSSVLETHAATRNNRPIVMGHPKIAGSYVSANSPEVLQDYCFGFMFNSVFDDNKIKVEAWLDPLRAKEVGPAAENVIARLESGENVEVSEGNYVIAEYEAGVFNGKKYGARWLSAVSDHLAMLDVNEEGACSNKMGCGRLQANSANDVDNDAASIVFFDLSPNSSSNTRREESRMKNSIFARMIEKLRASMSNNSLRWKLYKAISELEPGVQYVDDEDLEAKTVRYVVMICFGYAWDSESEMEYHTYQRTFSVDADNDVTVNDDRVELVFDETKAWVVKPTSTTDAVPDDPAPEMTNMSASTPAPALAAASTSVSASASSPIQLTNSCQCQNNKGDDTMATTAVSTAQKNFASKLITSTKAPFDETDRAALEAMSEEKLNALVKGFEDGAPTTATASAATDTTVNAPVVSAAGAVNAGGTSIDPTSVTITREEYVSIKAAADAHAAQIAARKSHLVTSLKTAQSEFTEADLIASDLNTLEKLARAFKIDTPATADYSLRGVPSSTVNVSAADSIKAHKPTDTWAAARANRGKIRQQAGDAN